MATSRRDLLKIGGLATASLLVSQKLRSMGPL